MFTEALFGILLFSSSLLNNSSLLFLPSSYLFVCKFMFIPALFLFYDDQRKIKSSAVKTNSPQLATAIICVLAMLTILSPLLTKGSPVDSTNKAVVEIRGKYIYVNDEKFIVQGINYSPWRSGTGPNKSYPYPESSLINEDLEIIKKAHANTILCYDPPAYVLDLCKKDDLFVVYTFAINWWAMGTSEFSLEKERILKKVEALKGYSNILAWELGNEIPTALLERVSPDSVEKVMKDLYASVKAIDPKHYIIHGNWPPTKALKFDFFDMAAFNVYPAWPPEVVVQGYEHYIAESLQPIANKKPLLITEFGVSSLEVTETGQARITGQCWKDLLEAGACGGIVFSFADEWWKNYDNPKIANQWWNRKAAPDDEKVHDADPEEYYGLVNSDRTAKPAYDTVAKMFGENSSKKYGRIIPAIIFTLLFLFALGAWLRARKGSPSYRNT